MRKLARVLGAVATMAILATSFGVAPRSAQAQAGELLSFSDFTCPSDCPPGAEVCCSIQDTIYIE